MITEIKHSLYFFYKLSSRPILSFWLIYLGIITLLGVLAWTAPGSVEFQGANTLPSIIFCGIYAFTFYKTSFSFVIKHGITRNGFIVSLLIFSVLLSVTMTTISNIFFHVINWTVNTLSIEDFNFAALDFSEFSISGAQIILFEGLVHLFVFLLFSLSAAILYRFGLKLGACILIILPASMFIRTVAEKAGDLATYLLLIHDNYMALNFLVPYSLIGVLMWYTARRTSVNNQLTFKS